MNLPSVPQAPSTLDELAQIVNGKEFHLTSSQRNIAQTILADPDGCAFMTISELARLVGVNESTVVRFAVALGLDGYPALSELCKRNLRDRAQLVRRFDQLTDSDADELNIVTSQAKRDKANISRTFAKISTENFLSSAQLLARARDIYVMGLRQSYPIAYLLSYQLQLIRAGVQHLSLESGLLPERLRGVAAEDVFIAIGIDPYPRDMVRAAAFAEKRGASIIALTDNPNSPIARNTSSVFYLDTDGVSILPSITAFISLAQALAASVATILGVKGRSVLEDEEILLQEFDVYSV